MIEILKNISFFSGLSDGDLKVIAEKVQMDYFPADHIIFSEGDKGEKMYIVKRGEVQVSRANAVLAILKDNSFFGEMALVSDEPRNATVKTVTDVEVLIIDKNDFNHILQTHRSIASIVSYEVVKRANAL